MLSTFPSSFSFLVLAKTICLVLQQPSCDPEEKGIRIGPDIVDILEQNFQTYMRKMNSHLFG